jgi:hypothetical protein
MRPDLHQASHDAGSATRPTFHAHGVLIARQEDVGDEPHEAGYVESAVVVD